MWNRVWPSHSRREKPSTAPRSVTPNRPREPSALDMRISEELKNEGNELFRRGKYLAAAEKYTEAIDVRPYWTGTSHREAGAKLCGVVALVNRANCYKKLQKWDRVENDCRTAISNDNQHMKAHYFLGLALEERHDHATALIHLEKSYELARDKEDQIVDEIWRTIARVSYAQWESVAQARSFEQSKLKTRLTTLLREAHQRELHANGETSEQLERQSEELNALERLFQQAARLDQPTEIPSSITCVLSMDIFRDPVVAPSGFSYERSLIQDHLERVGGFDPVTRQPIEKSQLIRNLNLRSMAHLYLKEHPWAWKESM